MNSARRSMADSIWENCGHCTLHGELLCTRRCTIAVPNVIRITSANEDMFHPPSVCLSVCLSWAISHENCWSDLHENFTRQESHHQILKVIRIWEFLSLWDKRNSAYFAGTSRSCREILMKFFEGWGVSLATNHSISVLIWVTTRIQEYI